MRILSRATLPALFALLLVTVVPVGSGLADAAAPTSWAANCWANVRSRPSTSAWIRTRIEKSTVVTVSWTVQGSNYGTSCGGWVSGRSWLAVSAIDGHSVRSLYGVAMLYVAAGLFRYVPPPTQYGVDISQWNGRVNFTKVADSGRTFVIARATVGRLITDTAYARNRAGALKAGLSFTAYHFALPDPSRYDAIREADHFLAVAQLEKGMLMPALDLETAGGLSPLKLQAWVRAWLERVYDRTGLRAMIYTNQPFWRASMANTTWFAQHGYTILWIARWATKSPTVPAAGWSGRGWTMWQYSDCGHVPGIPSRCTDLDQLRGVDLAKLTW
ncbi:MAG TPA: glycoside hydrolase family 25 protein [Candidatus Limnocylindrales bacterium]|nr:glycoside hydrolase family 25 protein [Candidatus Limnocylindrales bacterium]